MGSAVIRAEGTGETLQAVSTAIGRPNSPVREAVVDTWLLAQRAKQLGLVVSDKAVNEIRDEVQQAVITDVRNLEAIKSVISADTDEVIITLGESMESSILCTLHVQKIGRH